MYTCENHDESVKVFLTKPLFEKYCVRRSIEKATTLLYSFFLFAALFAFIVLFLGKFFPTLNDGLYYISYTSVQLFGIGLAVLIAYFINGFFSALTAGVISVYFGVFCTQVAGVPVIGGSSVIGFMGYFIIGIFSAYSIAFLHKVCIVVIEWAFGIILKLVYKIIKDEEKRENLIAPFRPLLKSFVFLGDSLVVMALAAFSIFFVMNFLYALPMTLFAHKLAAVFAESQSFLLRGAIIGFSFGFDFGGPVTLAVFDEILKGVLAGSLESARLMTIFSSAMLTPSWICIVYYLTYRLFKKHPVTCYDENLLNSGFINEVFQNVRLMAAFPMSYAAREPETATFAFMAGSTVTGIFASLFGITNKSLLTTYAQNYGLLRTGTILYTEKYDAFAGLFPPLYAHGGARVILLSFAAALIGTAVGYGILILLKEIKYSHQEKKGEDIYLAFGYTFTKKEWTEKYAKKSYLEKRLGLAKENEETFSELPA